MTKHARIDYKWVIAGVSFLMVFTVLGFCSSSKSLYFSAITEALSVSRSSFAINDSCRYITTSIVNMFFGALMARFGAKKLILAGFIALIISCLLYSVGTNVFVFYLGGIFLGLGISWTTTTMVGAVINKWFTEHRGTVMGAVLASNGIGAALSMQIVSPIIYQEANKFGYQDAYRLVAMILFVVGLIVVALFKDNPTNKIEGDAKKKKRGEEWEGSSFAAIIRKPHFYGALFSIFVTGMILQGITGVAAPLLRDVGLSDSYVANVMSMHALALTVFKFGVGAAYDKFGLRKTANTCFITSIVVMVMLANVTSTKSGMILAMIYGIFSSLALPLETIMIPIFAGDLFGQKSYHKVLGIFASVNTAGFAVGSPITNLCYDLTGSYNLAIYISCGLMLAATIVMHFVIRTSRKEKACSLEAK